MDQVIAAPVVISLFFTTMGLMEGKSLEDSKKKVQNVSLPRDSVFLFRLLSSSCVTPVCITWLSWLTFYPNPSPPPFILFCGEWQTDFMAYLENQLDGIRSHSIVKYECELPWLSVSRKPNGGRMTDVGRPLPPPLPLLLSIGCWSLPSSSRSLARSSSIPIASHQWSQHPMEQFLIDPKR